MYSLLTAMYSLLDRGARLHAALASMRLVY
jgi:hypothetical protein